jgi:hypothetical protein
MSHAPTDPLRAPLLRLRDLLARLDSPRAAEVEDLVRSLDADEAALWRGLNANVWWGGAGSLAAETLGDNPGLPPEVWQAQVHELRELLIDIGEVLMARGDENPGISSWVLAFRNWNASGV